jgi:hypothetical protein
MLSLSGVVPLFRTSILPISDLSRFFHDRELLAVGRQLAADGLSHHRPQKLVRERR